ncbi:MAG: UvrD-helicase domain-containing protein [Rickettsiales bacterium]|nr:UvrD-helicase domain-containing protein [Rickettsiales bacterium]
MDFSNLNKEQLDAVKTLDGPLLVLAGAGTGKTKVLTSRIINIVSNHKASPFQILAVTFTNKAAAEMRNRIGDVIGDKVNNLWVGTFHSIASKILRRHAEAVGLKSNFVIIDDDDQTRLLKQILADFNIDIKQFSPKSYLNKISRFKDKMVTPQQIDSAGFDVSLPKLKDIYMLYQDRLKAMNAVDFGDLLMYNIELFSKNKDIQEYYKDKFKYVLVDEYQDTNDTQYQWLLRLVDEKQNLCCVGDDDQSIYSWRGANVENILRFEKEFKNAKVIRLEQNYRSTSRILNAADSVIKNNKARHGKKLWSELGEGQKVKVNAYFDDRNEAASTALAIKDMLNDRKYEPNEIAILVRAGYQTRSFEEAFIQNSISYRVIGGVKFYERLEIRDAISYMRVAASMTDDLALNRIINTPKRGVGAKAIENLYIKARNENTSLFEATKRSLDEGLIKGKAKDSLKELIALMNVINAKIGETPLNVLAKELLKNAGYIDMYKEENTPESQGRLENIEEFFSSLADFSDMTEFLEYVSLVEAKDNKNLKDAVTIMTIHGAKGLEFDMVFVPGLEDGLFPSHRSIEERKGVEEERRLMYVAITRAKKELVLSYAKSRYVFGDTQMQIPSRFIKELPQDEIDFREIFGASDFLYSKSTMPKYGGSSSSYGTSYGQKKIYPTNYATQTAPKQPKVDTHEPLANKRVFHQKFGYGKVLSVNNNKLQILFEKTGVKTVIKDFVTLA